MRIVNFKEVNLKNENRKRSRVILKADSRKRDLDWVAHIKLKREPQMRLRSQKASRICSLAQILSRLEIILLKKWRRRKNL